MSKLLKRICSFFSEKIHVKRSRDIEKWKDDAHTNTCTRFFDTFMFIYNVESMKPIFKITVFRVNLLPLWSFFSKNGFFFAISLAFSEKGDSFHFSPLRLLQFYFFILKRIFFYNVSSFIYFFMSFENVKYFCRRKLNGGTFYYCRTRLKIVCRRVFKSSCIKICHKVKKHSERKRGKKEISRGAKRSKRAPTFSLMWLSWSLRAQGITFVTVQSSPAHIPLMPRLRNIA